MTIGPNPLFTYDFFRQRVLHSMELVSQRSPGSANDSTSDRERGLGPEAVYRAIAPQSADFSCTLKLFENALAMALLASI